MLDLIGGHKYYLEVHDGIPFCLLTLYFYGHNCLVCPGPRPRQRCRSLKETRDTSSFPRWVGNV